MTAAALPLWLAAFGIVLRGAGFAFRKEVETLHWQRLFGATFAFSSLLVPFFMGTVIGAIASGRVPANPAHADLAVWTGPTSLLIGALFVAVCGYLAAVFLTREAGRRSDDRLRRYFALRAAVAGAVSGALSLATLVEIHSSNPALFHGLSHRALPLVIVSAACGLAVLALLATGRSQALRPLTILGVAAVVWGWGAAQYPALLPGTGLTLTSGSAPHSILVTVVVVFFAAALLVGPSFLLLFSLHGRQLLEGENLQVKADETGAGR
jgi:cytochrome d ubiquinol oxidase subunit II